VLILSWPFAVILFVAVLSVALTGVMRRYALVRRLLDTPNARSSHRAPVPRGGGVAIVVSALSGSVALWWLDAVTGRALAGLVLGGLLVAAVGYLDDHRDVRARWRIVVHGLAATGLLVAVGGLSPLAFLGMTVAPGIIGGVVVWLSTVWIVNLYNFMDGIDGIAAIEAVTVCAGAVVLLGVSGAPGLAALVAVYGAAALGFLAWNWPPARIFMGDVGSGFLGFSLAGLAVLSWTGTAIPVWSWLILLGAFIVDATVTLLRRIGRRERWYEAHCNHAYQHAARRLGAHRPVASAVGLLNLGWLLPMAALSVCWPRWGAAVLVVAYLPLIGLVLRYRAGLPAGDDRD
jgi:Fuc2NAc and GlcNAc transferase